ncbi:MAG: T9SS type A sorting domain-containing protein [Flavobacteriales bacterium]|nr:T9SS type A sorting domain-containing protein [Flavobacteriales bacterium]
MHEHYTSLLFIAVVSTASGQDVIHSVDYGTWAQPDTWDCNCVPSNLDSVYIDHHVSHYGPLVKLAGSLQVGPSGELYNHAFTRLGCMVINHGLMHLEGLQVDAGTAPFENHHGGIYCYKATVDRADFYINGDFGTTDTMFIRTNVLIGPEGHMDATVLSGNGWIENFGSCMVYSLDEESPRISNYGYMDIFNFDINHIRNIYNQGTLSMIYASVDSLENNGSITLSDLSVQDSYTGNGHMIVYRDLEIAAAATMTVSAPGYVEIPDGNLTINGVLDGDGCIAVMDTTENNGVIEGTLQICDLTPTGGTGPGLDINTGTISASVAFCSENSCTASVHGIAGSANITISPNPADGHIMVSGMRNSVRRIELFDMQGRQRATGPLTNHTHSVIPVADLPNGTYVVMVTTDAGVSVIRAVVAH